MTGFANPRSTLAPRTPSIQCVPSLQNGFETTFNRIPEWLDSRPVMLLLTACHHQRPRWRPQKASAQSQNSIQYP